MAPIPNPIGIGNAVSYTLTYGSPTTYNVGSLVGVKDRPLRLYMRFGYGGRSAIYQYWDDDPTQIYHSASVPSGFRMSNTSSQLPSVTIEYYNFTTPNVTVTNAGISAVASGVSIPVLLTKKTRSTVNYTISGTCVGVNLLQIISDATKIVTNTTNRCDVSATTDSGTLMILAAEAWLNGSLIVDTIPQSIYFKNLISNNFMGDCHIANVNYGQIVDNNKGNWYVDYSNTASFPLLGSRIKMDPTLTITKILMMSLADLIQFAKGSNTGSTLYVNGRINLRTITV